MPIHQEANLTAIIENTKDILWSVGLDYRLTSFNRALEQGFQKGYGVKVTTGMTPRDLLPPARAALFPLLYERTLREGPIWPNIPCKMAGPSSFSFNPIVVHGETTGISVYGKDITERKKAENALREAEAKYRTLYDGALEGIFQTTLEGQPLTVNPAMARILGYDSPEDFIWSVKNTAQDVWVDPRIAPTIFSCSKKRGFYAGMNASSSVRTASQSGSR